MTKYKFAKEIEDFLNVLKDVGGFGIEDMEPIEARNLDLIEQESPEVKGVVEIGADGPFGPIPMYDYTPIGAPENKALPAIIFYHGGGWVIGSRDGHDSLCRYLSNATGCRVFSVACTSGLHPSERKGRKRTLLDQISSMVCSWDTDWLLNSNSRFQLMSPLQH